MTEVVDEALGEGRGDRPADGEFPRAARRAAGSLGDFALEPAVEVGAEMATGLFPPIAAEDLEGRAWTVSDFRGKVLILDFWASW